jgi:tetratricopeptide (TPR) repeat protein
MVAQNAPSGRAFIESYRREPLKKLRSAWRTSGRFGIGIVLFAALSSGAQAQLPRIPEFYASPSGSFLAARIARAERDVAAASNYYRSVLRTDPKNPDLLELAFLTTLQSGAVEEAFPLAERLIAIDRSHRIARLALGVKSIGAGHYAQARTHLSVSGQGPIADLVASMLTAWTWHGSNNVKNGVGHIDKLAGPDWYGIFKNMHAGLILDAANQRAEALRYIERARKQDPASLRTADAYARMLSRNGKNEEALKVYEGISNSMIRHPLVAAAVDTIGAAQPAPAPAAKSGKIVTSILNRSAELIGPAPSGAALRLPEVQDKLDRAVKDTGRPSNWRVSMFDLLVLLKVDPTIGSRTELAKELGYKGDPNDTAAMNLWLHEQVMNRIVSGGGNAPAAKAVSRELPPLVANTSEGAAEALYGIGAALSQEPGGEDLGMVYLQLAIHLNPEHPLAIVALASLFEATKKYEMAIDAYDRIPEKSPLRRKAMIQRALNLEVLEKKSEAREALKALVNEKPEEIEGLFTYANVLRAGKDYNEATEVYSRIVKILGEPKREHWAIYYYRGMSYERAKLWPSAEKDFQQALKLSPDNPQILNYLGYSWVDRGEHLDQALDMIRKAVALRPKDGYIIDSLGWAYYRLGKFEEAVVELEKAIALSPSDPTINDHLGDAYWRTDRKLEARFQWARAIEMKPEPEDLLIIQKKLKEGLESDTVPARAGEAKNPDKG